MVVEIMSDALVALALALSTLAVGLGLLAMFVPATFGRCGGCGRTAVSTLHPDTPVRLCVHCWTRAARSQHTLHPHLPS